MMLMKIEDQARPTHAGSLEANLHRKTMIERGKTDEKTNTWIPTYHAGFVRGQQGESAD